MRHVAIGLAVVFVVLVAFTAWYGLQFVHVDFIYGVETEFDEVPVDDAALEQWIQGQPGVFRAGVERQRVGRQSRIVVILGMTQNIERDPPFPDLSSKCAELGYRGQQGPFRDQPR